MPIDSVSIQTRLQALAKTFADQLPQRLSEVDMLWKTLQETHFCHQEDLKRFCHILHSLAGSAGMLGQAEVGHHARLIEQEILVFLETNHIPDTTQIEYLNEIVKQLHRFDLS